MFKFLLIFGVAIYLIYKIGSFFYRMGAASQHFRHYQEQKKSGFNHSKPDTSSAKKESKAKGGDYIDYEEVK